MCLLQKWIIFLLPATQIQILINLCYPNKVRAAAVTALAKFGAECPNLRPSICILLKRCLLDTGKSLIDQSFCT